ncbi:MULTISPECIES: YkgJ family cysteine cluster protein [Aquitalea]|uniref:YkgJ family cysteine cluster protein n=1 Tax=Aquitalea TaxID=407217 RepID=UPI0013581266|nr:MULTISPECIES: YkgJ family cysteine cluster protein [Aquitalea]
MSQAEQNICQRCGACCAAFRVSFHYSELDTEPGGCVPARLADEETATIMRMRGTDYARPRCIALVGKVGESVSCGIYSERPSPCREFGARASIGIYEEACNRARAQNGLPRLQLD